MKLSAKALAIVLLFVGLVLVFTCSLVVPTVVASARETNMISSL